MAEVAVIGSGAVGVACAAAVLQTGVAERLVLYDRNADRARGEALDFEHGSSLLPAARIEGRPLSEAAPADLAIMAAGARPRPGASRMEVLDQNLEAAATVADAFEDALPSVMMVVTNPVDPVTEYLTRRFRGRGENEGSRAPGAPRGENEGSRAPRARRGENEGSRAPRARREENDGSRAPRARREENDGSRAPRARRIGVFGSGTALDSWRLRECLASRLGVHPQNVHAWAIGEHGLTMVLPLSCVRIGPFTLNQMAERHGAPLDLDEVDRYVRRAGPRVHELKGSTTSAIGLVAARLAVHVLREHDYMIPVSVPVEDGLCASLPARLGPAGAGEPLMPDLTGDEQEAWRASLASLREAASRIPLV